MSVLIHDDFLLSTAKARKLYHEHASDLPIIDDHCHLDAKVLAADLLRLEHVLRLNTMILCQVFGRDMAEQGGGAILNFASMTGRW